MRDDVKTLGITQSVCERCRRLVPAKILADEAGVYLRKFCTEHGETQALVRRDADEYLRAQRFVKAAWRPDRFRGDAGAPCPDGCGFCDRHEQHLCMPIVEITRRCDLACPVCLTASGDGGHAAGGDSRDLSLEEFRGMVKGLLAAERQIDVLNLSGGEPLLHPGLMDLVDEALSHREIVRVSVSTNGLRFLEDPSLLSEFRRRDVVVSLQFDGLNDEAYRILRGRPLRREKTQILDRLREADVTTSLTMTAAAGVNDDQFPAALDYLFRWENIVSLMVQPLALAGRAAGLRGRVGRLSIPDVVRGLGQAGHPVVRAEDFVPLPCSHPLCLPGWLMCGRSWIRWPTAPSSDWMRTSTSGSGGRSTICGAARPAWRPTIRPFCPPCGSFCERSPVPPAAPVSIPGVSSRSRSDG
jgi:7,8-dihydro-6-hydroxymethylpterin dimethyltransferase